MILVRVRFAEWERFWAQFTTAGADRRREHGSRGVRVLHDTDDAEQAFLLFDWDRDAFERFRTDPEVQATMRAGGAQGPPEAYFLDEIGTLDV